MTRGSSAWTREARAPRQWAAPRGPTAVRRPPKSDSTAPRSWPSGARPAADPCSSGWDGGPRGAPRRFALVLLRALAHRPYGLHALADLVGLHHRTVRRYLQAFDLLGVPVVSAVRRTRAGPRERVWWAAPEAVWAWLRAGPPPRIRVRRAPARPRER